MRNNSRRLGKDGALFVRDAFRIIDPGNFETSIALDHRDETAFENEDSLVSHPQFRNRPIRSVTGKVQDVVGAEIPA